MTIFRCPFCHKEHESGIWNGADVSCCGEIGRVVPIIGSCQWCYCAIPNNKGYCAECTARGYPLHLAEGIGGY